MTENIGELVAEHPLFSGLPADVAKLVAGCSQNVAIATGQLLLEEGEPARSLYLLRRGHVALEVHEPGRVPLVIDRIGPGQAVGWSWMFPRTDGTSMPALSSQSVPYRLTQTACAPRRKRTRLSAICS